MRSHRIFSSKKRGVHEGLYPLNRLKRQETMPNLAPITTPDLHFSRPDNPHHIVNAMADHQAMMDTIRDGHINAALSVIPDCPQERATHLKAFAYFQDASLVGIGPITDEAWLAEPKVNPEIDRLAQDIMTRQTKTLASGIDHIMADLRESVSTPARMVGHHDTAIVIAVETYRDPYEGEAGTSWITDAQLHKACLLATENATILSNYIRLLGFDAKTHSYTSSDLCLNKLAVSSGLCFADEDGISAPFIDRQFGLAVISTNMSLAHDLPLAPKAEQPASLLSALSWKVGYHSSKSAFNQDPFKSRDYKDSTMPLETLKRVDKPTTYMDEANIPRVPKRADMFARAQFGDMGTDNQKAATGGYYAKKAATSAAQRRALGAFVLLQDGEVTQSPSTEMSAQELSDHIKATSYFLGVDAVGISACPDWAWYSHDARGDALIPPHDNAISMVIDQGFETMEGASGDDWISVAQSMRAYLRFSLLGGVMARQLRNLGYSAKAHTVLDGEVLQPPLLLLSGLGEVSRIGEVILHPFLGPRLKSGVVTTDLVLHHDKPIDFGLQNFCNNCQKCARECPSGAITAGPKKMFNGYEIWKSDSQKCTTYRITTKGGAMCGRCMKTCPWNLEGLFAEAPFRWMASHMPVMAKALAGLDDAIGRGDINPIKKWWWDIEITSDGSYRPTSHPVNARGISPKLHIDHAEQTMAVYPAPLAPHPYPYPFPMDREAGIEAYKDMISAESYQQRKAAGDTSIYHRYTNDMTQKQGFDETTTALQAPVLAVTLARTEKLTANITKYELRATDGKALPAWQAGAHIDVVVAPEYLRAYSLCSNPADQDKYEIAVLNETNGRGGSALLHRIFTQGRKLFISPPINHFPLEETADHTLLLGGGIGVTPMIGFAHRLHDLGRSFELHYSVKTRDDVAFAQEWQDYPFAKNVHIHVSDEGSRLDADDLFTAQKSKGQNLATHIYICGPDAYMGALNEAALKAGFADEHIHIEYFTTPEQPDYVNHPFKLKVIKDDKLIDVAEDETAADALIKNGYEVDIKCADGLCGVCQCGYLSGEIEHRDYVLSKKMRESQLILCQSRAAEKDAIIEIEL